MREVIHHWWILLLRAAWALLLAVFLFLLQAWMKWSFLDAVTMPMLLIALAAYGIMDSLLVLYLAMQFESGATGRTIGAMQGLFGVAIGVLLVTVWFRPAELSWFFYIISAQAITAGVFELLSGFRFRKHVQAEWTCFGGGLASLAFGLCLLMGLTATRGRALDWFLGYALLLAVSMGWFSYTLHRLDGELRRQSAQPAVVG